MGASAARFFDRFPVGMTEPEFLAVSGSAVTRDTKGKALYAPFAMGRVEGRAEVDFVGAKMARMRAMLPLGEQAGVAAVTFRGLLEQIGGHGALTSPEGAPRGVDELFAELAKRSMRITANATTAVAVMASVGDVGVTLKTWNSRAPQWTYFVELAWRGPR